MIGNRLDRMIGRFATPLILLMISNWANAIEIKQYNQSLSQVASNATIPGNVVDIGTDGADALYVLTDDGMLHSFRPGSLLHLGGTPVPGGEIPVALATSATRENYVVRSDGTVVRFDELSQINVTTLTGFSPVDVTVASDGLVYVATDDGTIHKLSVDLAPLDTTTFSTEIPTTIHASHFVGAIKIFVGFSNGIVRRLSPGLVTQIPPSTPEAPVPTAGPPVDISTNSSGNTTLAYDGHLQRIGDPINVLPNDASPAGPLVGVSISNSGTIVSANEAGTLFQYNIGLNPVPDPEVDVGFALAAVAIDNSDRIYVAGPAPPPPAAAAISIALDSDPIEATVGTSGTSTVTVTNTGGRTINTLNAGISSPFSIVAQPSVPLPTTAGSNTSDFTLRFDAPTTPGTTSATLTVGFGEGATETDSTSILVTGMAQAIAPPPAEACYYVTGLPFSGIPFASVLSGTDAQRTFDVEDCSGTPALLRIENAAITVEEGSCTWDLSPDVPSPILAPQTFTLTMNASSGLTVDEYCRAKVSITTNDEVNPPLKEFFADGTASAPFAQLQIAPEYHDMDFGDLELGFRLAKEIVIRNIGNIEADVQVTRLAPLSPPGPDPDFDDFDLELDQGTDSVGPMGLRRFWQTFAPQSVGADKRVTLRITCPNCDGFTFQNIVLHGNATSPVPIDAVLVLDRSGSMSEPAGEGIKIENLREAARMFVEHLRDGIDYLGLTIYNQSADNELQLGGLPGVRSDAEVDFNTELTATGSTGIGTAMLKAAEQYALSPAVSNPDPEHRKVMVVLTDGVENVGPTILDVVEDGYFETNQGLATYSVGLGDIGNVNESQLQQITNRGEAGFHFVTGNLDDLRIFDLTSFYFKILTDALDREMVIDPTSWYGLAETLNISVPITLQDREGVFLFIGELPRANYVVELLDPTGAIVAPTATPGAYAVQERSRDNWLSFTVKFPEPGSGPSHGGSWTLRARLADATKGASALLGLRHRPPAHRSRHRMAVSAAVGSNYRLAARLAPGIVEQSEPIGATVTLAEGGIPSPNAQVISTVLRPDGGVETVPLFDDGLHGDGAAADGLFGVSYVNTSVRGTYRFWFRSDGLTVRGEPVAREAMRSQYVGAPPAPTKTEECISCWIFKTIIWIAVVIPIVTLLVLLGLIWRRFQFTRS